jgi:hypothetical protein
MGTLCGAYSRQLRGKIGQLLPLSVYARTIGLKREYFVRCGGEKIGHVRTNTGKP